MFSDVDSPPHPENPPLTHTSPKLITPDHSPTPSPPPPPPPDSEQAPPQLAASKQPKVVVIPPPQPEKPSTTIPQTKDPDSTFAGTQVPTQAEKEKHKKRREKKRKEHHGQPSKVHIKLKYATTLTDAELGQILKTLAVEAKTRSQQRRKELDNKVEEQVKFLNKCINLAQSVMPEPVEIDNDNPLKIAYQRFESMVSALQA